MAINRTEEYVEEADEFSSEAINARPKQASSGTIQSGWDAAEQLTKPSQSYTKEFKFTDGGIQIVKFLDENGPYAVYRQHFIERKLGQKSYICLGATCPLCVKLNDKALEKRAFSIVNLSAEGGPTRQVLIASARLWKALHAAHFSAQGPLTRTYWALNRTGEMQTIAYNVSPIKGRDLMEDWNIDEAVAEKVVAESKPFTSDSVRTSTWEELDAIADSLL
jgi:hypothetical protein